MINLLKNIGTKSKKAFSYKLSSKKKDKVLKDYYQLIEKNKKNIPFPALNSIGYKQISDYLDGKIDKNELFDIIVNKTWQYARKQNQWFKKECVNLTVDTTNLDLKELGLHISDIYRSSYID